MNRTDGFAPIIGGRVRVLILGTLPSQQSLEMQQYYGHPRNAFWPIMGRLFGAGPELPYRERTRLLTTHSVAVWDVLAAGVRPGSMDAAIDKASAMPNDFDGLGRNHPELQMVCFNGQSAARLFRSLVPATVQQSLADANFVTMPSTSPAYAAMDFAGKLARWAKVREVAAGRSAPNGRNTSAETASR